MLPILFVIAVTHTMASPHPGHYLPAVNPPFAPRPPFVTPGASEPNIVLVQHAHPLMHPPPNVTSRPSSRRGPGQQAFSSYRTSNSFSHSEQVGELVKANTQGVTVCHSVHVTNDIGRRRLRSKGRIQYYIF